VAGERCVSISLFAHVPFRREVRRDLEQTHLRASFTARGSGAAMQLARAACRGARPRLCRRRAASNAAPASRPLAVAAAASAAAPPPSLPPLRLRRGVACAADRVSAAAAADDDAPEPFFWRGGDTYRVPVSLHADNRARLREAICASLEARGIEPGIVILQARAGGVRVGYWRASPRFIRFVARFRFSRVVCAWPRRRRAARSSASTTPTASTSSARRRARESSLTLARSPCRSHASGSRPSHAPAVTRSPTHAASPAVLLPVGVRRG
jgi:hypothetical protein